jgi:hypothetical protein
MNLENTRWGRRESNKNIKAPQVQEMFRRHVLRTPNTGKILNIMLQSNYMSAKFKCVLRNLEEAKSIPNNEVSTTSNHISSVCFMKRRASSKN